MRPLSSRTLWQTVSSQNRRSPPAISTGARGFIKAAVRQRPRPHPLSSSRRVGRWRSRQPIMGAGCCRVCHTMRSATGNIADPTVRRCRSPIPARVLISNRMRSSVLIRLRASAPPASAAFAVAVMSVTFGESLTISGFVQLRFTSRVTFSTIAGSTPKATPPSFTLGHDILSSNKSVSVPDKISATARYSSTVAPAILAMTTAPDFFSHGSSFFIKQSTPGFCSPIAFRTPEGVSVMRGGGFPSRGLRVIA